MIWIHFLEDVILHSNRGPLCAVLKVNIRFMWNGTYVGFSYERKHNLPMFKINVKILSLIPNPASSMAFHIGKKLNLEMHTDYCSSKIAKGKQFLLEQGTFQAMNPWPIWIMHLSTHISSTVIKSGSMPINNFFKTANSAKQIYMSHDWASTQNTKRKLVSIKLYIGCK